MNTIHSAALTPLKSKYFSIFTFQAAIRRLGKECDIFGIFFRPNSFIINKNVGNKIFFPYVCQILLVQKINIHETAPYRDFTIIVGYDICAK